MLFQYHGDTFDTETMAAFATGLACMPTIYVTPERICFLELTRKQWKESHFRILPRGEALRYATLYQLAALREILSFTPRMGVEKDIVGGLERYVQKLKKNGRKSVGGRLVAEIQEEVDSIEAVCRTEHDKNDVLQWTHPFVSEFSLRRGTADSNITR